MRVPVHLKVKVHKVSAGIARKRRVSEVKSIMDELPLQKVNSLLWYARILRNTQELSNTSDFETEKRHTPSKI